MGTPFLLLFGWIFFNSITDKRTGKEVYLDIVSDINCSGIVDSIYRKEMSHNTMVLKTKYCEYFVESEWENKFIIGDSISKRRGKFILEHYRNGKLFETLNYQNLKRK